MAVTATVDEVHRVISAAVDGAFYRSVYPDLRGPEIEPVGHYVVHGWREGRDPAPWFSSLKYVASNDDVRRLGVEPLYHYLTIGRREGRTVWPSLQSEAYYRDRKQRGIPTSWAFQPFAPPPPAIEGAEEPPPVAIEETASERHVREIRDAAAYLAANHHEVELVGSEFDGGFYLERYLDIGEVGEDPLRHFILMGWREGRDPNARFSTKDYLEAYPDIVEAGINPFYHYLLAGRAEGRHARAPVGFRYHTLAALAPVAERVEALKTSRVRIKPAPAKALAMALAESRAGLADLHLTFSHDDYTANLGGVQMCLQREDARVAGLGRDHLHLYPMLPWPVVRTAGERGVLGVVWNGENLGAFEPATVAKVLKAAAPAAAGARSFAIHSLLGHSVDETIAILQAVGLKAGYFWLHDFASLCAGYHLLRNDVEDCAAPPPESPACGICAYLPMRRRHLDAHGRLFAALDLTVVSPSQSALDLWRASWRHPAKDAVVLPHAALVERGRAPSRKGGPLRIAYAGLPAAHKGWEVFRDLVLQFGEDDRYEFLHLGARRALGSTVAFHEVVTSAARPRAMQETLAELQVDAVLAWPLCRETFSFLAYEAVAAGCAVITGPDSGNIAAFVAEQGHGEVLPTEDALRAAFASGEIARLARAKRKPRLYDLKFSGLTVDLLQARP